MAQTRERIIQTASELLRRNGYLGTGLKQISTRAEAPFGSVYHFFPGGKEELGVAAIRKAGDWFAELGSSVLDEETGSLPERIERVYQRAGEDLRASDFADACPIATVALEISGSSEPLRCACVEVFEQWLSLLTTFLHAHGVPEQHERELALGMLGGLEGAFVLARAMRDTEPLRAAGAAMATRARALLESSA